MRHFTILLAAIIVSCAAGCGSATRAPKTTAGTLATLRDVRPDVQEMKVEQGLDQAMTQYRRFLDDAPENAMTPEAMRRLADLQLEKQFGIHNGDPKVREMAAPESAPALASSTNITPNTATNAGSRESDADFEKRTTGETGAPVAGNTVSDTKGPLEAIGLYDKLLTEYPSYEQRDKVLYQQARAYDELGRTDEAIATMERLIKENPKSEH